MVMNMRRRASRATAQADNLPLLDIFANLNQNLIKVSIISVMRQRLALARHIIIAEIYCNNIPPRTSPIGSVSNRTSEYCNDRSCLIAPTGTPVEIPCEHHQISPGKHGDLAWLNCAQIVQGN